MQLMTSLQILKEIDMTNIFETIQRPLILLGMISIRTRIKTENYISLCV